jgi:3-phenylpropionate/trans-cinnamate dioxygenase ferredoxin reductase subunit
MSGQVVIVGGGLAGQRCAETLRRSGHDGSIVMVCEEPERPYDRPPLSKEVLLDGDADAKLSFRPAGWYEEKGIELRLAEPARTLDCERRVVHLTGGEELTYEHLLIATGSRPRRLPTLEGFENVSVLRAVGDARLLRGALTPGARLLVIGAGFIGQEAASAACKAGASATIVEAGPAPLGAILGEQLGLWFADLHRSRGVSVHLGQQVAAVHGQDRISSVTLSGGAVVECDHVLVGVGVQPNVDWLDDRDFDRTGVRTDCDGRTAVPDVYAAGDAAAVLDPMLGRHVPGNHWESAARQGARAAKAMLGIEQGPASVSSFWSDLHGTRIQYLGHAPLADRMSLEGDTAAADFTAVFTRQERPIAVLLAGRPQMLPQARELLNTAS